MRLSDSIVEKLDAYLETDAVTEWENLEAALSAWLSSLETDASRGEALAVLRVEIKDLGSIPEFRQQMTSLTAFIATRQHQFPRSDENWG